MARAVGVAIDADLLSGWTPIRVRWVGAEPVIDWCFTGEIEFSDSFFEQTVNHCFAHPLRLLFRRETTMEQMGDLVSESPGLAPSGFIFHASRCGSTLVAQMLAALGSTLVMSEPGPVESVLGARRRDPTLSEESHQRWFRWIVSALGRPQQEAHKHYVVKLDAWAVFELPFIRRTFPNTPWIFLYRDPIEILVSQLTNRGPHLVPGYLSADQLGFDDVEMATQMTPVQYCAVVLGRIMAAGRQEANAPNALIVNYTELPEGVAKVIAPHFGIPLNEEERGVLAQAALRDAKSPSIPFIPDGVTKRERADSGVVEAALCSMDPIFQSLESIRMGRS